MVPELGLHASATTPNPFVIINLSAKNLEYYYIIVVRRRSGKTDHSEPTGTLKESKRRRMTNRKQH